jgi:uncharacterized protein (DUF2249 family)
MGEKVLAMCPNGPNRWRVVTKKKKKKAAMACGCEC